jgi:hypothetical protein
LFEEDLEMENLLTAGPRTIALKLDGFAAMQSKILEKYENLSDVSMGITKVSMRHFVGKLDRYILHTVEEIAELNLALDELQEEPEEEAVDVLLYSGTIAAISRHNEILLAIDTTGIPGEACSLRRSSRPDLGELERLSMCVLVDLVSMRRLFPERKWHVRHEVVGERGTRKRVYDLAMASRRLCASAFDLLVAVCGESQDKSFQTHEWIWSMMEKKHRKIMDLEMPR